MSSANNVNVTISTTADTKGVTETEKSLSSLSDESERSSSKTGILSSAFSSLGSTIAAVGGAMAAYGIVQQMANFGETAFSTAGELEQTNMSFQNLIGNTKDANALFSQLVQYANTTPFQAKDVTDAAKQLLAFGETAGDTTTLVKQLGDVAAAGGGDLQAMSLVSGQVFAQGKMRAQDMYQVINDGGAGLIHIMAQNAGGMQNLTAEFDKGGIPAKAYFDAINEASGKGGFAFQGAQKQAQTFNGQISTLKDSVAQFGMAMIGVHVDANGLGITPGGIFDRLKGAIGALSGDLSKLGPLAGRAMGDLLYYSGEVITRISNIANKYIDWNSVMDKTNFYVHDFVTAMKVILTGDPDQGMFKEQKYKDLGNALSKVRTIASDLAHDFKDVLTVVIGDVQLAWDNLQPSLDAVWHTFKNNLLPALSEFWNTYGPDIKTLLKDLAIAFGTTLYAAVWLAINAVDIILTGFSDLIKFITDHKVFITDLAIAFGTLAISMAFGAVFNALTVGFATLTLVTIPSVMASFGALAALITAPMTMPAIVVGAALIALWNVRQAALDAQDAIDNAKIAASNLSVSQAAARRTLENLSQNGTQAQKDRANKALASGIYDGFSSGGFTGTGGVNEVAGVVHKGEYVIPQNQVDQRTGQPKAGAGTSSTTFNNPVFHFHTADATNAFFAIQDRNGALAGMGMSINRSYA